MFNHSYLKPMLLAGLVFASGAPGTLAATPGATPIPPGQQTARVWFLRPASSANTLVWGASPMIYANGEPIVAIPPNSSSYLDLPAGTYSFTVQPYGYPTGAADTVRLTSGSQTYLEIQWVSTWEMGYASGGGGDQSHAFFVLNMAPQLAQAYLQTLHYFGRA